MPRMVLGGLVSYLGLAFLAEWLVDTWRRVARMEHANPAATATFHLIMARLLAERTVHLITTVDALQR